MAQAPLQTDGMDHHHHHHQPDFAPPVHSNAQPIAAAPPPLPIIEHVRQNFGPVLGHLLEREVFRRGWMEVDVETLHINLRNTAEAVFQQFQRDVSPQQLHSAVLEMISVILQFAHGDQTPRLLDLLSNNYPTQVLFSAMLNPPLLKNLVEAAASPLHHPPPPPPRRGPHGSFSGYPPPQLDDMSSASAQSNSGRPSIPTPNSASSRAPPPGNINSPNRGSPTSSGPAIPLSRSAQRAAQMQQMQMQGGGQFPVVGPNQPQQPIMAQPQQSNGNIPNRAQDLNQQQQHISQAQVKLQAAMTQQHQHQPQSAYGNYVDPHQPSLHSDTNNMSRHHQPIHAPPPLQQPSNGGMGYPTGSGNNSLSSFPNSGYASTDFSQGLHVQAPTSAAPPANSSSQPSTPAVPFSPLAAAFSAKPKAATTPVAPPPTPASPPDASPNLANALLKQLSSGHGGHLSQTSNGISLTVKGVKSPNWADDEDQMTVKVPEDNQLAAFLDKYQLSQLFSVLVKNTTLSKLRQMTQAEFDEATIKWIGSASRRKQLALALHPEGNFPSAPAATQQLPTPASQRTRGAAQQPAAAPAPSSSAPAATATDGVHYIKIGLRPDSERGDPDPPQPTDQSFRQASRRLSLGKNIRFSEVLWQPPKGGGGTLTPTMVFTIPASLASTFTRCETDTLEVDGIHYKVAGCSITPHAPRPSKETPAPAMAEHHHAADPHAQRFSRQGGSSGTPSHHPAAPSAHGANVPPLPRSPKAKPTDVRTPPRAGLPRTPDQGAAQPPALQAGNDRRPRPRDERFVGASASLQANGTDTVCRYFNTSAGCKRGTTCMFKHEGGAPPAPQQRRHNASHAREAPSESSNVDAQPARHHRPAAAPSTPSAEPASPSTPLEQADESTARRGPAGRARPKKPVEAPPM